MHLLLPLIYLHINIIINKFHTLIIYCTWEGEYTKREVLDVELKVYSTKITSSCSGNKCMISVAYGRHMDNTHSSLFLISPTLSIIMSLHVFNWPVALPMTFSTTAPVAWTWVTLTMWSSAKWKLEKPCGRWRRRADVKLCVSLQECHQQSWEKQRGD